MNGRIVMAALCDHFRAHKSAEKDLQFLIPAGGTVVRCEATEIRETEDVVEIMLRRLPE